MIWRTRVFLLATLMAAPGIGYSSTDDYVTEMLKKRQEFSGQMQRSLVLPNQLPVLLISDPKTPKCAASMDVFVGSWDEPAASRGIAHYLEHVLFMGTKKYPETGSYSTYMESHQGWSNAFTAGEDTNYLFQVNPDAFPEGLDRFAGFFSEPTFTAKYLEKEKNAVDAEYQKNIKNDYWRQQALVQTLVRKDHPMHGFDIGNLTTLKGVDRDTILAYYNKYYSANNMRLAVICNQSLDEQEALVRKWFATVKNHKLPRPVYDQQVFAKGFLPKKVYYKPLKDQATMSLVFPLPEVYSQYRSKPVQVISWLLGREGTGSLYAILKDEGYINKLAVGADRNTAWTFLELNLELTDKGEEHTEAIESLVFSYINLIKKNGLPKHLYEFLQAKAELDYVFAPPQAPAWQAVDYAMAMKHHPATTAAPLSALLLDYRPDMVANYVQHLAPENHLTLIQTKKHHSKKPYLKEPYFAIDYLVTDYDAKELAALKATTIDPRFSYPQKNTMLPTNLKVYSNAKSQKPTIIVESAERQIWFQQDHDFATPHAEGAIELINPNLNRTPRSVAMSLIWQEVLNDHLAGWKDLLQDAGISLSLAGSDDRLVVRASGYADRLPEVLAETISKVKDFRPSEARFADQVAALTKEYKNVEWQTSISLANRYVSIASRQAEMDFNRYRHEFSKVTFGEFSKFVATESQNFKLLGLIYGSLDPARVSATLAPSKGNQGQPSTKFQTEAPRILQYAAGKKKAFTAKSKTENNAWFNIVQLGKRTPETEAVGRLWGDYLGPLFFNELRDNQQLGYIVNTGASTTTSVVSVYSAIQSQQYTAGDVAARATSWVAARLANLEKEFSEEKFQELKKALLTTLAAREQSMGQRFARLKSTLDYLGGDFEHHSKLSTAVRKLTREALFQEIRTAYEPKTIRSFSSYVTAAGKPQAKILSGEELVKDLTTLKKGLEWYGF